MKGYYYPDTDSLYINLSEATSVESREVAPGVVLDFDADGRLVGIDLDHASKFVDLTHLEAEALPVSSFALYASSRAKEPMIRTLDLAVREPGATYTPSSEQEDAH